MRADEGRIPRRGPRWVAGGKRAVLRDLPGVSRIRFHGPEVGVVFALSIGFPSVVWGQWHGEMPTVDVAVWFSQGGRLRPAYRVRIYASERVVVRTRRDKKEGREKEGWINPGGKRRRISQRDLSPSLRVCLCVRSLSSGNDRASASVRERGISPSLYVGERVRTYTRAYIYARSFELCSSPSERGKERKSERAEEERGREVDGESTEEVEGRLASIRERDADRVGESWVRSHKEVDTRRHLNPPCPPSRPPVFPEPHPYSSAQPPLPPSHREPPIRPLSHPLAPRSFRLSISPTLAPFALHPLYIAPLSPFLSRPPSLFSLCTDVLYESLFPLSRRETHPRSRSAKLRLPEDRRGWLEDFFVTAGRCCAS